MMTRKQAIEYGFTIDDGQRPIAYRGPRFNPIEWYEVPTEKEEILMGEQDPNLRIARLIMTLKCNRHCVNCCNEYVEDMDAIHIKSINDLSEYDQILITGGEPMLYPDRVIAIAQHFGKLGKPVFMYTSLFRPEIVTILKLIKGVHYTLHAPINKVDLKGFYQFQTLITNHVGSYRLYIDPNIDCTIYIRPSIWNRVEVKPWRINGACPLPIGETLFILDP